MKFSELFWQRKSPPPPAAEIVARAELLASSAFSTCAACRREAVSLFVALGVPEGLDLDMPVERAYPDWFDSTENDVRHFMALVVFEKLLGSASKRTSWKASEFAAKSARQIIAERSRIAGGCSCVAAERRPTSG
jgi:hypothetical protein